MTPPQILIVDDDHELSLSLVRALKANSLKASMNIAGNEQKAKELYTSLCPEVIVLDLCIDPTEGVESGYRLLTYFKDKNHQTSRVIVLTGHGSDNFGVRALSLGAASFLTKPPSIPHIQALIEDGINQARLSRELVSLQKETTSDLVGSSQIMNNLRDEISLAAISQQPVLIRGQTGTGKGVVAKEIHRRSPRRKAPLIRYQPSFTSADLVASELFGHSRGAFTGATGERKGLVACADGGSLFLDEIESLPSPVQVSLLGVIQEKAFRPLGEDRETKSDFRLIAASNANLEERMSKGEFRPDLYHRLAHQIITVPCLKERKEDLQELVTHFLIQARSRGEGRADGLSSGALQKLQQYDFPGNVRELEAITLQAMLRADLRGSMILEADDFKLHTSKNNKDAPDSIVPSATGICLEEAVLAFKRESCRKALAACNNNQMAAARLLGIDRSTLRRILEL